jgi:hypothetical protein
MQQGDLRGVVSSLVSLGWHKATSWKKSCQSELGFQIFGIPEWNFLVNSEIPRGGIQVQDLTCFFIVFSLSDCVVFIGHMARCLKEGKLWPGCGVLLVNIRQEYLSIGRGWRSYGRPSSQGAAMHMQKSPSLTPNPGKCWISSSAAKAVEFKVRPGGF